MEERELPVGWEIVDLGQITTVLSGNGFPKEHQRPHIRGPWLL